jgi:leucyl-tRNA synthetase
MPNIPSHFTDNKPQTEKRDTLIAIEKKYQSKWQEDGVFQSNAPTTTEIPLHSISAAEVRKQHPKFFGTMAYPYMNGTLHAGRSRLRAYARQTYFVPYGISLYRYADQSLRRQIDQ